MRPYLRTALRTSRCARRCAVHAPPPVPIVSSITSTNNSYIKHCVKLRINDKYRKQQRRVLLASQQLIEEQLAKGARLNIVTLFVTDACEVSGNVVSTAGAVVTVDEHVMKKLSGLGSVAAVKAVAEVEVQPQKIPHWDIVRRLLVLDQVQDPGNLGTLLRNAEALRWDAVFLMDCCDPYNEKAIRAARGSTFQVHHETGSWSDLKDHLNHHQITLLSAATDEMSLAADKISPDAEPAPDSALFVCLEQTKVALVLGSEGQGVRPEILIHSHKVAIPMAETMDSMNVAAAGSMIMLTLSQCALHSVLTQVSRHLSKS
eukprot:jgi/Ulvmu1/10619/UM065_0076.1